MKLPYLKPAPRSVASLGKGKGTDQTPVADGQRRAEVRWHEPPSSPLDGGGGDRLGGSDSTLKSTLGSMRRSEPSGLQASSEKTSGICYEGWSRSLP